MSTGWVRLPDHMGGGIIKLDAEGVRPFTQDGELAEYHYIWTAKDGSECELSLRHPLEEVNSEETQEPGVGVYLINNTRVAIHDSEDDMYPWLVFDAALHDSGWMRWTDMVNNFGDRMVIQRMWQPR